MIENIMESFKRSMGSQKVEDVAIYFVNKGISEGIPVTPMRLQKFLYFDYGWYFVISPNEPLFNEQFEAWKYGPVCNSIYYTYKSYKNNPISIIKNNIKISESSLCDDLSIFLDSIWNIYNNYSSIRLSNETHRQGTPWHLITDGGKNIWRGSIIEWQLMKEHFCEQFSKYSAHK
jgi:uncharacterized phage-associated protein